MEILKLLKSHPMEVRSFSQVRSKFIHDVTFILLSREIYNSDKCVYLWQCLKSKHKSESIPQ